MRLDLCRNPSIASFGGKQVCLPAAAAYSLHVAKRSHLAAGKVLAFSASPVQTTQRNHESTALSQQQQPSAAPRQSTPSAAAELGEVQTESLGLLEWAAVCRQVAAFTRTPTAAEMLMTTGLPLGSSQVEHRAHTSGQSRVPGWL